MTPLREIQSLTVRARVAVVAVLARFLLADLRGDHNGLGHASAAVDAIFSWCEGKNLTGMELHSRILDATDSGVAAFVDARNPRATDAAYNVVQAALAYAAWHAFVLMAEPLPQGYEAMSEDFLAWAFREAEKSPSFDAERLSELIERLKTNHTSASDTLGQPIRETELT